MTQICGVCTKF